MIPIRNRKKTLQVTIEEMRSFAFAYIEKYAPSKQQLKTYLLKKYMKVSVPDIKKQDVNKLIDIVLSDMAINTTGSKSLDSYNTGELCLKAMDLALQTLSYDGVFLTKVFMGSIFSEINMKAKSSFKKIVIYKPMSSKKESKEIYIYCKGILKVR